MGAARTDADARFGFLRALLRGWLDVGCGWPGALSVSQCGTGCPGANSPPERAACAECRMGIVERRGDGGRFRWPRAGGVASARAPRHRSGKWLRSIGTLVE